MISKIILGLFSIIVLFQANQVYGAEELPIITIDFTSGNIIDLDESPQIIRADIQIQNYNPQDGYHFMEITRVSNGEIIRNSDIIPKVASGGTDDDLFEVQILHYIKPDQNPDILIGDYMLRIYSEFGSAESGTTFSIIKSSMPPVISQNISEVESIEEKSNPVEEVESLQVSNSEQTKSQIPVWVHDIFVWYADETISENELLTAIEYLISQGILEIDSN